MSNVTVMVLDELMRRREQFGEVDWSEVACMAFEEAVERQEKRAAEEIRVIRSRSSPCWDGVATIRRGRDASRSSRCTT